jgi:hypothetical protein
MGNGVMISFLAKSRVPEQNVQDANEDTNVKKTENPSKESEMSARRMKCVESFLSAAYSLNNSSNNDLVMSLLDSTSSR